LDIFLSSFIERFFFGILKKRQGRFERKEFTKVKYHGKYHQKQWHKVSEFLAGAVHRRVPLAIRKQRRISVGRGHGDQNNLRQRAIKNHCR
jgi:hypothetical protein